MPGASFEAAAGEIHALLGAHGVEASLIGDASIRVAGVAPIGRAQRGDLAFIRDERFLREWDGSEAGVTLVSAALMECEAAASLRHATDRAVLVVPDADLALIALLSYAQNAMPSGDPPPGIHPSAVIDESATIDPTACIGPCVTIGAGATVGAKAVLRAHTSVGLGATIGAHTVLREHVTLSDRCEIGERCILHPGVVIGADGFGYRPPAPEAGHGPFPVKVPHIGIVRIGHDVEIGANTCIDRATHGVTTVADGCKIDNQVQIGHNCTIGPGTIICGLSGIAGSATIGAGVTLAGSVLVSDHRTIGDGASIAGNSGVSTDVPAGETWGGFPARPIREHMRIQASAAWLGRSVGSLKQLIRVKAHDA